MWRAYNRREIDSILYSDSIRQKARQLALKDVQVGDRLNVSISNQCFVFAVCIFCGGAIGFLFDLFRITRRLFRTSNIFATTEDIVFWIVASAVFFAVVLKISSGEIRFFQLVALFIGTVLYFLTISPLIIKVSVLVLRFVARVLIFIVKCNGATLLSMQDC